MEKIIDPVERELLHSELTSERLLRSTNKGDNEIYIVDAHNSPNVMLEIGRLREIAFRDAGGGTGKSIDIDEFDMMETPCQQLIVWNPTGDEIIGGYRFILGEDIVVKDGIPNIATSHMFNFSERFLKELLPTTIELGRSFVTLEYQTTKAGPKALYALDNLWDGLGALTVLHPSIEYLFGKVTMYPNFGAEPRDILLGFLYKHFPDPENLVRPIEQLESNALSDEIQALFTGPTFKDDYRTLNHLVRLSGRNIPPLVNAYMGLSPTMRVFGTAINHEFGEVEETGIFFKISEIFEEKKARHIGTFKQLTDFRQ
ncbi:MAG: GNAT family N-acetyltransferase [Clostridium sp.]|nr:GNAT family N-acetyltransferase [Prevotella sp.]MCM1429141.1 GNAT family N-acetyltransferase [Clostridium sp.]MCM1475331.1 GNAT family N-acetyltransferase [Muribaculaceae bacterium]